MTNPVPCGRCDCNDIRIKHMFGTWKAWCYDCEQTISGESTKQATVLAWNDAQTPLKTDENGWICFRNDDFVLPPYGVTVEWRNADTGEESWIPFALYEEGDYYGYTHWRNTRHSQPSTD